MSNSGVPRIELNPDGTVTLYVRVDGFRAGTPVEISGYATQTNGAVATFRDVQLMPSGDTEEGVIMVVRGVPVTGPNRFSSEHPIIVVAQAADTWIDKLDPDTGDKPLSVGISAAKALSGQVNVRTAWNSDERTSHSVLVVDQGTAFGSSGDRSEVPQLTNLIIKVGDTESQLRAQLLQQGINLVQDEVEDVNFTFEMSATPSLGELIEAISQVDRAIRVAAGIAACRNGQLGIGPRSYLRDLGALEKWLQDDSEAWDLAIDKLELGSFLIKLRPKGESNKKIVKNPAATLALLASLSQITGVTATGAAQDVMGGKASHSIVQVSDVSINVPGPSDENIIVRLPSDSKLRETIDLGGGKSIVLEIQTESKGTVSS